MSIECSICAEKDRIAVDLCKCSRQSDKQICEVCAVTLYRVCTHPVCNCFGFECPYCRKLDKTSRNWHADSALYWKKKYSTMYEKMVELSVDSRLMSQLTRGSYGYMNN